MQVSVEAIGALGRRLTVAVPADRFEKAFSDRLKRLAHRVKVPGFRPGKVPLKMLEQRYGGSLMEEVAGEIINTTLKEALGQEGLKPAAGPRIRHKTLERGKELEYVAEFEIYPEITRLDLTGTTIERPVAEVADADVERTLETIRRQRAQWRPIEREAREGDRLTIDFTGRLDGEVFEGGSATQFNVELGKGTLIEGLEQGLIGAKRGEVRKVEAKFPPEYPYATLRGRTVEFDVQVHEVAEAVLPDVNDELAKQLGVQEGGLEKLRADVKTNLEREAATRGRKVVRTRVMKSLLDVNQFEVPQGLLNAELARMNALIPKEVAARPNAGLEERARRRVALGLIMAEIVRRRGIKADPARVRAKIEELAAEYESPQEFIQWNYGNRERLAEVESLVMEEQIVEQLLATAQVVEQPTTFEELIKIETSLDRN